MVDKHVRSEVGSRGPISHFWHLVWRSSLQVFLWSWQAVFKSLWHSRILNNLKLYVLKSSNERNTLRSVPPPMSWLQGLLSPLNTCVPGFSQPGFWCLQPSASVPACSPLVLRRRAKAPWTTKLERNPLVLQSKRPLGFSPPGSWAHSGASVPLYVGHLLEGSQALHILHHTQSSLPRSLPACWIEKWHCHKPSRESSWETHPVCQGNHFCDWKGHHVWVRD